MSRGKIEILPIRIVRADIGRGWPRALGVVAQAADGSWRVRLRCEDGVIRRFRAQRYGEGAKPGNRERLALKPDIRFAVLTRDRFTCRYCGRSAPEVRLHVDHVLAVAKGGLTEMSNLVAACVDCNLGKGTNSAAG